MSEADILEKFDRFADAVIYMAKQTGQRLTRAELCDRLKIHRNTLTRRMEEDPHFPRPDVNGRWLLSEVLEWEKR